jgi:ATP-binding cassette subfamily F protein 3
MGGLEGTEPRRKGRATPTPVPPPPKPAAPINKEAKKELQRQQRLFQELEGKIAALTIQKSRLEASLADPSTYSDKNRFITAETEYKKTGDELNKANRQYEQVFDKIVELEKTL